MPITFHVRKKTSSEGVTISEVEDGLEAACKAYPELNLETLDVHGDQTYVLDVDNDVMYIVTKVNAP
jgi:hypothetical protein